MLLKKDGQKLKLFKSEKLNDLDTFKLKVFSKHKCHKYDTRHKRTGVHQFNTCLIDGANHIKKEKN